MTTATKIYRPNVAKLSVFKSFLSRVNLYNHSRSATYSSQLFFERACNEGIDTLLAFSRNYSMSNLIQAAQKFIEASTINPKTAEPYIYLAWLYFLAEDKASCSEYLAMAEKAQPGFPEINKVRSMMFA